ncbi:MAG: collagen-like protein [Clostridiales bacterium]|jgi:hypothetical protein|nr:collagen-like protein [Clostridiales bacterium]
MPDEFEYTLTNPTCKKVEKCDCCKSHKNNCNDKQKKCCCVVEGPPGPPGCPGLPGCPGKNGKDGKDGVTGPQGEKGNKGDPGNPGENGKNGEDGKNGKDGVTGPQGEKGNKGDPGDPASLKPFLYVYNSNEPCSQGYGTIPKLIPEKITLIPPYEIHIDAPGIYKIDYSVFECSEKHLYSLYINGEEAPGTRAFYYNNLRSYNFSFVEIFNHSKLEIRKNRPCGSEPLAFLSNQVDVNISIFKISDLLI